MFRTCAISALVILPSTLAFAPAASSTRVGPRALFAVEESTPLAVVEAPNGEPATPPPATPKVERFVAEKIEGSRRKGQDSFADVDTKIFERNPVLDSVALAGDYSFDPFSLATDKATLLSHRSSEIRHSRLAMVRFHFRQVVVARSLCT